MKLEPRSRAKSCSRLTSTAASRYATETSSAWGRKDSPKWSGRCYDAPSTSRDLHRISPLCNRNPVANGCILDFRQHHPRNQLQFASVGPILDNAINRALLQSEIQQFCGL